MTQNKKGRDEERDPKAVGNLDGGAFNAFSMMGAAPSAMKILQTSNMIRDKASDIGQLLKNTTMGDLSTLPVEFMSFSDDYSLLMMETRGAIADNRKHFEGGLHTRLATT